MQKGAFTGATARKAGRFELADGGTLFLDEIGELALDVQAKLLRVLQDGEFERLGGTRTLRADVRIIAATNRSLAERGRRGAFSCGSLLSAQCVSARVAALARAPPGHRSAGRPFRAPLCGQVRQAHRRHCAGSAFRARNYRWPGNVRELQHVIERAVILTQGGKLALGDWFSSAAPACDAEVPKPAGDGDTRTVTLEEAERSHILRVLEETGWRVSGKAGAAERLGLKPTTLESRMKRLAITRKA